MKGVCNTMHLYYETYSQNFGSASSSRRDTVSRSALGRFLIRNMWHFQRVFTISLVTWSLYPFLFGFGMYTFWTGPRRHAIAGGRGFPAAGLQTPLRGVVDRFPNYRTTFVLTTLFLLSERHEHPATFMIYKCEGGVPRLPYAEAAKLIAYSPLIVRSGRVAFDGRAGTSAWLSPSSASWYSSGGSAPRQ